MVLLCLYIGIVSDALASALRREGSRKKSRELPAVPSIDIGAGSSCVCVVVSFEAIAWEDDCTRSLANEVGAIVRWKFRATVDWHVRTMSMTIALTRSSIGAIWDSTIARRFASTKRGRVVRL